MVGCAWWLVALYLVLLFALFAIRGRPYGGDSVVSAVFPAGRTCCAPVVAPILVFLWNVVRISN